MATQAQPQSKMVSLEEYFEMEFTAETRHEFWNGEIRAMAYTSEAHGEIVANLTYLLKSCLKGKECKAIPNDRMIYVPSCNKVFYPDVAVVCGTIDYYNYSKKMQAWLNPTILIEVLSDSTQNEDKIDKWDCYRRIKSLKQYLMIDQNKVKIEVLTRNQNNEDSWTNRLYEDENDTILVGDCLLKVNDIYENII